MPAARDLAARRPLNGKLPQPSGPRSPRPRPEAGGRLHGRASGLTLFIDADDTLWENNIHFEAVIRDYCSLLEASGVDGATARATLLGIERVRTKTHGYGVANFNQSLREACRRLAGDDAAAAIIPHIDARCDALRRHDMEVIDGVEPTLEALARRHRLVLFTKGDEADQRDKVARSGLAGWFHAVDVVKEKHPEAYREALIRHGVTGRASWMIGNSPRSDVMPALAAGLGVVFVPHPATWVLELDALPDATHPRLLVLERFAQLTDWF